MEPEYFTSLLDKEIDDMIEDLTSYQREKFDQAMIVYDDDRHALFIARSFPPKKM